MTTQMQNPILTQRLASSFIPGPGQKRVPKNSACFRLTVKEFSNVEQF